MNDLNNSKQSDKADLPNPLETKDSEPIEPMHVAGQEPASPPKKPAIKENNTIPPWKLHKPDSLTPDKLDDRVTVDGEATNSQEYASFGKRFLASFIDSVIVSIVTGIITFALSTIIELVLGSANEATVVTVLFFLQIPVWLIGPIYYIYFIGKKGQTWGKMAMSLKVVNMETNKTPGYVSAFLREVVGKVISSIVFGIGYLWMLKDDKKQTWHDKIAGTIVVTTK